MVIVINSIYETIIFCLLLENNLKILIHAAQRAQNVLN